MALTLVHSERLASDALDAVERVMMASRLSFERMGDEDITGSFAGGWCDYELWFAYRADLDVLHFASGFDMRVPDDRRRAVVALINLINESLWIGHFDLWAEEGRPTWRHALLLRGTDGVEDPQVVDLVTVGSASACASIRHSSKWLGRSSRPKLRSKRPSWSRAGQPDDGDFRRYPPGRRRQDGQRSCSRVAARAARSPRGSPSSSRTTARPSVWRRSAPRAFRRRPRFPARCARRRSSTPSSPR